MVPVSLFGWPCWSGKNHNSLLALLPIATKEQHVCSCYTIWIARKEVQGYSGLDPRVSKGQQVIHVAPDTPVAPPDKPATGTTPTDTIAAVLQVLQDMNGEG